MAGSLDTPPHAGKVTCCTFGTSLWVAVKHSCCPHLGWTVSRRASQCYVNRWVKGPSGMPVTPTFLETPIRAPMRGMWCTTIENKG